MATIILIEEQQDRSSTIRQALEVERHEVLSAATMAAAIQTLSAQPVDAVVIHPSTTPVGEQRSALDWLHEAASQRHIPVVLCIHPGDPEVRASLLERGADEILIKPFSATELNLRLRFLFEARAQRRTVAQQKQDILWAKQFGDDLLDLLAYDLKGPLAIIVGNLEFLERALIDAPPQVCDALDDTIDSASELNRIFANLFDVVRSETDAMPLYLGTVQIDELFAEVVRARRRETHQLALHCEAVPSGIEVPADRWVLRRVIENIIDNCMRYTPRGGRVQLRARREGEHVRLEIGNTGPAVPSGARIRLFERVPHTGQRSSSPRQNLGLGLYFCKLAANALKGTLTIEDDKEFPTLFVLTLPGQIRA